MKKVIIHVAGNRTLDAKIRRPGIRPGLTHRNRFREARDGYRKHRGGGDWSHVQRA